MRMVVEGVQVALPHAGEGEAVEPRVVGDEADDAAAGLLGDASLGHAEEADVEVVEPLSLGASHAPGGAVGGGKLALLVDGHAGEAVVGRVAEDHEYGGVLLDALGAVALLLQLGEREGLLDAGLPSGECVGEEDAGALVPVLGEGCVEGLHGEADLEVCYDERGGHYLEAEDAAGGGALHLRPCEGSEAAVLEVGCDAAQDLGEVCAGAAAGVEDVDVVGGQAVGDAEVVLEGAVDAGDHVAHDLDGGVPDAELLAECGVEGLEEGLVEVGDGLALAEAVEEGVAVDAVEGGGGPVEHLDESRGAGGGRGRIAAGRGPGARGLGGARRPRAS